MLFGTNHASCLCTTCPTLGCSSLLLAKSHRAPPRSPPHLLSDLPLLYVLRGLPAFISPHSSPTSPPWPLPSSPTLDDPVTSCSELAGSSPISSLENEIPAALCGLQGPSQSCFLSLTPCSLSSCYWACLPLSEHIIHPSTFALPLPWSPPPLAHHTPLSVKVLNHPLKAQWKCQFRYEALASLPEQK